MDPASARLVRNAIKNLRSEDRSIIVCTHNLSEAEELADKIAIIRTGEIIALGSSSELKQQLLGPGEFRVQVIQELNNHDLPLPPGLELLEKGYDWFSYRTNTPQEINPRLVAALVDADMEVLRLEEVQRSLESVYLQAVNNHPQGAKHDLE
jgi:ABC-2 type transport system ATP-binding protein